MISMNTIVSETTTVYYHGCEYYCDVENLENSYG